MAIAGAAQVAGSGIMPAVGAYASPMMGQEAYMMAGPYASSNFNATPL